MTRLLIRIVALAFFLIVLTLPSFGAGSRFTLDSLMSYFHRPAFQVDYGFTTTRLAGVRGAFPSPRLAQFRIGSISTMAEDSANIVMSYEFNFLSLTNISNELGNKGSARDINSDLWRLGFGNEHGMGYNFGTSAILGYNGYGLEWSRFRVEGRIPELLVDSDINSDSVLLAPFDQTVRFGTHAAGGIRVQIIPLLSVDAGYERAVVFPAHQVWKWLGSAVIEAAAQGLVDQFVGKVLETSPAAAPVVNFVLKNAISYGAYELRKDKMNWPFNSDPPLRNDSFKVGLMFTF